MTGLSRQDPQDLHWGGLAWSAWQLLDSAEARNRAGSWALPAALLRRSRVDLHRHQRSAEIAAWWAAPGAPP